MRVETNKETRNRATTTTTTNAKKHNKKNMRLLVPRPPNQQIQLTWTTHERQIEFERCTAVAHQRKQKKNKKINNLETASLSRTLHLFTFMPLRRAD